MSFLEALSGIGGSIGSGLETGYNAQLGKLKRQQAQDEQAGNVLFGQTLQSLGGGQPTQPQDNGILGHIKRILGMGQQPSGIPANMSQGAPQGMAPPQPQAPMAPPGAGAPAYPGGDGITGADRGGVFQPTTAAPQGQPMVQQRPQPPMQPQGQPPQGQLDWRQIAAKVQATNPKAPPQVVAAAVNQFLPLMSQQAQNEWKQIQLQISQQRADEAGTYHQDLVNQRRDAADQANTAKGDALEQKKVEAQSKEFERTATAYEKLSAAMAGDSSLNTPANQALLTKLQEKMASMAGVEPTDVGATLKTKGPEQSWGDWFKSFVFSDTGKAAPAADAAKPTAAAPDASQPPAGAPQGTKKAPDGKWYAPDPKSPSGWSEVVP